MTVWGSLRARLSTWIDDVAAGWMLLGTMLRRSHRIELVEQNRRTGRFLSSTTSKQAAERADRPLVAHRQKAELLIRFSPQTRSLLARSTVLTVMLALSHLSIFRSLSSCPRARASFSMASSALKSIV